MTLSEEIFRTLFVVFGCFQLIANAYYLFGKNALQKARKQHQEIPHDVSDKQLRTKVICVLIMGGVFFITGMILFMMHTYNSYVVTGVLVLSTIYSFGEAMYYKYWRTFGFFTIMVILTVISIGI